MGKLKKQYFYAIRYSDGKSFIVTTWAECQKLTKGHSNRFKKFESEDEAKEWLKELYQAKETRNRVPKDKRKMGEDNKKVPLRVLLDSQTSNDLNKRAEVVSMTAEVLVTNLIKEYLYDFG